ncbi:MAG: hypothetical protein H7269_12740 [Cellulomonas sp.]|nr:hypothetical protein [Cellulomonas sp.]
MLSERRAIAVQIGRLRLRHPCGEFVDGTPGAHLDMAGTALADPPAGWRPRGSICFGARLLAELALSFGD